MLSRKLSHQTNLNFVTTNTYDQRHGMTSIVVLRHSDEFSPRTRTKKNRGSAKKNRRRSQKKDKQLTGGSGGHMRRSQPTLQAIEAGLKPFETRSSPGRDAEASPSAERETDSLGTSTARHARPSRTHHDGTEYCSEGNANVDDDPWWDHTQSSALRRAIGHK